MKKKDKSGLGGPPDKRTLNVMLGTSMFNQVDQTLRAVNEPVCHQDRKTFLPLPLRILSFIGGWILLAGAIGFICIFLRGYDAANLSFAVPLAKWGLGIGIPVFGGLRLLDAYLEKRDWVKRIRKQEQNKAKRY